MPFARRTGNPGGLTHDRPRLLDTLDKTQDSGVCLVSAPSGYGKTTLLVSWAARRSSDALVMVRLSDSDNDPVVLAERLWAAWLTMVTGPRGAGCAEPTRPRPTSLDQVLASMASHARDCPRLHVLVLDDVQRIANPAVLASLAALVESPPQGWAAVLSSREDPPLPWMTVRGRGALTELRGADLAMSAEEVQRVLADDYRLHLPDGLVQELAVATGGWPAGVRIAALELEDADDPASVLRTGLAANRYVARFFDTEVLTQLPPELGTFLETTSVLGTLYPALCDALTGRTDSHEVLRELVARGLFTEKGTDPEATYAYHPLFRSALEARLRARDPQRRTELLGSASEWSEAQQHAGEAIAYAFRAEDWSRARSLVLAHSGEALHAGTVTSIAEWTDAFPEQMRRSDLELSLLEAKAYLILFDRGRYRGAMRQVSRLLQAMPSDAVNSPRGVGAEIAWRFLLANDLLVRGRLDSVIAPLEEAVALDERQAAPDETQISLAVNRSSLQSALATGLLLGGKTTEAIRFADLMLDAPEDPGSLPLVRALGTKSLAHAWQGDEETASDLAEEGLSLLARMKTEANDPFLVHLAAAWTGCAPASRYQSLGFIRTLARRSGLASFLALAELAAARHALTTGNLAAAERALGSALEHTEALAEPGVLPSLAAQVSREVASSRNRQQPTQLTERERDILRHIAAGCTRRQAADELHLSIDTVKTHLRSTYRKLGVDNRDAAVARATDMGVLPPTPPANRTSAD